MASEHRLRIVRRRGDRIADANAAAGENPPPQTTFAGKELEYRAMGAFGKQPAGLAELESFDNRPAQPEAPAAQLVQRDASRSNEDMDYSSHEMRATHLTVRFSPP
jgi:hypothetical protein